jgi:TonB family protein
VLCELTSLGIRGKLHSKLASIASWQADWNVVMLPQSMSLSEARTDDWYPLAQPDLAQALERQIAGGFPPGLALDLVLNELVVRASTATRARAAALALKRGDEMVCRAATGEHAPDLGIPLNTRDGLSGACLRTGQSQLCLDTETDPRVDAATSRRLGIRSMLVVPVLDGEDLVGVLEVFATDPGEFVDSDQNLLEIFAREVTRIRRAAIELEQRPTAISAVPDPALFALDPKASAPTSRARYEVWSLVLGGLAILLFVAISFMIGSRVGWLGGPSARVYSQMPLPAAAASAPRVSDRKAPTGGTVSAARSAPNSSTDGLVVYEQGKVVFRMKPVARQTARSPEPSGDRAPDALARVWLAPERAESRLRQRSEPQYPADALAAHRSGDVVLEVVVKTDGSVASTRPVSGDPVLAAAASDAVRTWRYDPYRVQGRPTEFQTDVTLKFSLPD